MLSPRAPRLLFSVAGWEPEEAPTATQGPMLEGQSHLQSCPSAPEAHDCRHGTCLLGPRARAQPGLPRPLPSLPGLASESPSSRAQASGTRRRQRKPRESRVSLPALTLL